MAIAPMSLSSGHRVMTTMQAPRSVTRRHDGESSSPAAKGDVTSANQISDEISSQREGSFEYQIIRTLLMKEQIDLPAFQPGESNSPPDLTQAGKDLADAVSTITTSTENTGVGQTAVTLTSRQSVLLTAEQTAVITTGQRRETLSVDLRAKPPVKKSDPLTLDLGENGWHTSGIDAGVQFDLNGDGSVDRVSVPDAGNALLALDRNHNGQIDDGHELFGDQNGAANGYAELQKFDDNGDGQISAQDAVYAQLRLLQFQDHGHQQWQSLSEANIQSLSLHYQLQGQTLVNGDQIQQTAGFLRSDGSSGHSADLLLSFDQTV